MSIYEELFSGVHIPKLYPVSYKLPQGTIRKEDISSILLEQLASLHIKDILKPGMTVAITSGSREVSNIARITRVIVDYVKSFGATPFIFPSMGSHGGATAEGQVKILQGYGISEESMGCLIKSSMTVVHISDTPSGLPVYIDKYASEADAIIVIGRIKPHTDFRGTYESGLMKMLTIGIGKQYGANLCHSLGMANMSKNIEEYATEVIKRKKILFGVGIIEDAFHSTYKLTVMPGEEIPVKEPALLEEAKKLVPCIPFKKVDVLVLNEIGKDISGAGMDPNVTGRSQSLGISQPFIERIAVLDLTEKSHHNGTGIGGADATTKKFVDKMDVDITYPNCITSHDLNSMRIPGTMPTDELAVKLALHGCTGNQGIGGWRMVWMKNTLHLDSFYVSEQLLPEVQENPMLTQTGEGFYPQFDDCGTVVVPR